MKTAVIYARYSSDAQTEQSIEGQLRVCQEYAKNNNILIVDTYIDRAMTGTNDNRAAFQKMLKDSSNGQFSLVLVYKLDRFSRNKFESVVHKKTLKDNGVTVLSAMESISDTPEGRMLETILEGFNQYYSEELTQKVNRGLRESWIKGNYTGGKVYFGYRVVNKKFVVCEEEAEIVRYIFEKYSQGYQAKFIREDLETKGVRQQDGTPLTRKQVYSILHNHRYLGIAYHRGEVYNNIFPRIISDEVWQIVSAINEENKLAPSRKKESFNYLLTSKLICGCCKQKMSGESGTSKSGKMHFYYVCGTKKRQKTTCKTVPVQKRYLEDLVINVTVTMLKEKGIIPMIAQRLYKLHQEQVADDYTITILEQKRDEALKASKNIMKAIEQGIITENTKSRLVELEQQIHQLDFDIDQEKQRNYSTLTQTEIEHYLESIITENIQELQVRKLIINTFIKSVIWYQDRIVIVYNFNEQSEYTVLNDKTVQKLEKQLESSTSTASYLFRCSWFITARSPHLHSQKERVKNTLFRLCILLKKDIFG